MEIREIKSIHDGYLYDQSERLFYNASGCIVIPMERINPGLLYELGLLIKKYDDSTTKNFNKNTLSKEKLISS